LRLKAPTTAPETTKPPNEKATSKEKGERPRPAPRPDASLRPPNSLERANRHLLIEEIARLEGLVKVTHPKSPDRPQLLMRLAGAYAELSALAERDHTRLEIEAEERERAQKAAPVNKQLKTVTEPPVRRGVF
jgi:hypothetical protein